MIGFYDYLNIGVYFAFIAGIGFYFARRNRNTSDYFRAGGSLPWWIAGASAWMGAFTAWTFTGAAGKFYQVGPYVLLLYYSNIPALIALFLVTSFRLRRLRVITPFEALRLRFGLGTQQFYTWIRLPVALIFGAIWLNTVGVFMSAVFGMPLPLTITCLGALVTLISILGGALAVAASDFVQMFLVMSVTVIVCLLTLARHDVGGVSGLIRQVPNAHFHWGGIARPEFIVLWFVALVLNNLIGQNSLSDERAPKYLMARNERNARLMVVIPLVGMLITPLVWAVPPMAAAVIHPHLALEFPQLTHPEEAAFLVIAHDVLPQGMLGLLVCGIFAATLTHTDACLNQGAGMIVRNFYLPILNPKCSESQLLIISKAATGFFGIFIVGLAIWISLHRSLGLFDLLNQLGISLLLPLAVPACLGLFIRKVPSWSAWTTVVVGFTLSIAIEFTLRPSMLSWLPSFSGPYTAEETTVLHNISAAFAVAGGGTVWFLFTGLFFSASSPAYRAKVDEFFARLKEPLSNDVELKSENRTFPYSIGAICVAYGSLLCLFAMIPNTAGGRLCFPACGGTMALTGTFLVRRYRAP